MSDQPEPSRKPPDDAGGEGGADQRGTTLWQVVSSTVAAAFGVQSSRNRERDFTHGKAWHFILAGIVFTVLFVATLIFVVSLVL